MNGNVDFENLSYQKFRILAQNNSLSSHEKVGFPNDYREGKEDAIFLDILSKLPSLRRSGCVALDIGPGCSKLPLMLSATCEKVGGEVYFVDSPEMLHHLPDKPHIHKVPGQFPEISESLQQLSGKVDTIICYSVIQYVFAEGNIWNFIDSSVSLLKEGGEMLIGDIPNITMRKRLFCSTEGQQLHKNFTGRDDPPHVQFNTVEAGRMDDSVVLGIVMRVRAQGFHCWVIPQGFDLPMCNRREDILIRRP